MHWFTFPILTAIADVIALGLLVTSFVTEYWVIYDVDREALSRSALTDPGLQTNLDTLAFYRDRHKGLFRVCYTGDFDGCDTRTGYELNFEGLESDGPSEMWSDDYITRIRLMRTHLFSMGIAILFLLATLTLVVLATCRKSIFAFRVACGLSTISCFLVALAMAVFHGVEYVEKKLLKEDPYPAGWPLTYEHLELSIHTEINFGYSLYLGWVALVVAIVGTILVMWTGVTIPIQQGGKSDSTRSLAGEGGGDESYYSSSLARNRAYDIVDGKDVTDVDLDDNVVMDNKSNDIFITRDTGNFGKY